MTRIAVIEDGYVRDSQVYTGDPALISEDTDWEDHFTAVKNPCQFVGLFEGETEEDIRIQASEREGVHKDIILLLPM